MAYFLTTIAIGLAVPTLVASAPGTPRVPATIVEVVDGDTVKVRLASRGETVRLIGLNTPESVDPRRPVESFGRVVSTRMRELLPVGLGVDLEADPTQGDRDRFGRLLRYVFLPQGWHAAEVMIRQGFGFEHTSLDELQADLDVRLAHYNTERPHRGRWCYGKTPMQTFLDSGPLANEKQLAA